MASYLSLHGAMEVEGIGDGESDLVGAIRERVGDAALISVSLDLHGNIAPALVEAADLLTALRTAPHRDGEATRERALSHLVRCLREGIRPQAAMVKLPLMLPGEYAVTEVEPARSLYEMLAAIEAEPGIMDASLMIGCAWTNSPPHGGLRAGDGGAGGRSCFPAGVAAGSRGVGAARTVPARGGDGGA